MKHECQFCDKILNTNNSLNTHIKSVHEGTKNFRCETCHVSFKAQDGLKYHISSIHNAQKFKCDVGNCNREFTSST